MRRAAEHAASDRAVRRASGGRRSAFRARVCRLAGEEDGLAVALRDAKMTDPAAVATADHLALGYIGGVVLAVVASADAAAAAAGVSAGVVRCC